MVQAAIGALTPIVTGAASVAGGLTGALKGQSRRDLPRPSVESANHALAVVQDKKSREKILQNAREERLFNLISQPEVLGTVLTFAGVLAANRIRFSNDKLSNGLTQGAMSSASVLMGLGYAGVGDLTTAIVALTAGIGSISDEIFEGIGDIVDNVIPDVNIPDVLEPGFWTKVLFPWSNILDKILYR